MITWRLERNRLIDLRLLTGMSIPLVAGLALFGWRAAVTAFLIVAGAIAARFVLKRLTVWPVKTSRLTMMTQATLVAMFVSPAMFDAEQAAFDPTARWPIAIATGGVLAVLTWLIGRLGTARFSPTILTILFVAVFVPTRAADERVLAPQTVFYGDLLGPTASERSTSTAEPWIATATSEPLIRTARASQRIDDFLHARTTPDRPAITMARLVSDDLPPLEDLVILGQPTSIGRASAIAILIGGLFLVHRRLVAFRMPAMMLVTTVAALVVLPTPVIVSTDEVVRRWLAAADPRVGWAVGVTFVNYVLVASSALLVILFLAPLPGIRPLSLRAGLVFSAIFGLLCGVCTIFVSVELGAVFALAINQLLTPTLDKRLAPRALI
jgi:Na+-translocating ferredoxin:NAD+ oxidoreductase RnfD subunit